MKKARKENFTLTFSECKIQENPFRFLPLPHLLCRLCSWCRFQPVSEFNHRHKLNGPSSSAKLQSFSYVFFSSIMLSKTSCFIASRKLTHMHHYYLFIIMIATSLQLEILCKIYWDSLTIAAQWREKERERVSIVWHAFEESFFRFFSTPVADL